MAKKNLPNIPIYIGDWLKDCNSLSMQAQGAWLQIVFKLWTNGKQNSCKMSAKALQKTWKCGANEMQEIIEELKDEDICPISIVEEDGRSYYEFTCRRFVKENRISEVRSEAAKGKQKQSKEKANSMQITDIDNDYDNNILKGVQNKIATVDEFIQLIQESEELWQYRENFFRSTSVTPENFKDYLKLFRKRADTKAKISETVKEWCTYFGNSIKFIKDEIKALPPKETSLKDVYGTA